MEIINVGYFQTLNEESLNNIVEKVNLLKELRSDNEKLSQYIQNLSDEKLNSIIENYSNVNRIDNPAITAFVLIVANEILKNRNFEPYQLYKDLNAKKIVSYKHIEEKYSDLLKKSNITNKSITLIPRFRDVVLPFYFDLIEQESLLTNTKYYINELNNNIDYAIESYNMRFKM